jgi:hypothetical protein
VKQVPGEFRVAKTCDPFTLSACATDKHGPGPRSSSHPVKEDSMTRGSAFAESATSQQLTPRMPRLGLATRPSRSRRLAARVASNQLDDIVQPADASPFEIEDPDLLVAAKCLQRNRPFGSGIENHESSDHERLPQ